MKKVMGTSCEKYPTLWAVLLIAFAIIFLTIGVLNWWIYVNVNKKKGADDIKRAKTIAASYAGIILFILIVMIVGVYYRCLIVQGYSFSQDIAVSVLYVLMFLVLLIVEILGWFTYTSLNKSVVTDEQLARARTISLWSASLITSIFGVMILGLIIRKIVNSKKIKKEDAIAMEMTGKSNSDSISNFVKSSEAYSQKAQSAYNTYDQNSKQIAEYAQTAQRYINAYA